MQHGTEGGGGLTDEQANQLVSSGYRGRGCPVMGGSVVDKNWLTLLESLSQVQAEIGEFHPDEEDDDEEVNASYNYDDFGTGSVGRTCLLYTSPSPRDS